ncbi:hypothetical protein ACFQBQ_06540 [Granulicella cerasi]|uniref:Porin n=1 Tax=Granulicella cerasi TaxID=741063 RepID=A0ABW1Z6N8_9BACT|nr:hypothetical protein [Granulicella cerasi]
MKQLVKVAAALVLTSAAVAQTSQPKHPKKKPAKTTTAAQIEQLQEQLRRQQQELDTMKGQLADRDQQLSTATQNTTSAQQAAADAAAKASEAQAAASSQQQQVNTLQQTVTDMKATDQGLQETVVANQAQMRQELESPLALHYKGVTIKPVGFFAFEGVWRQRSVNSDINTPFNTIPLPGANEGHTSELNFSGRQSRIGALVTGDAGNFKLSGYFEADFLSSGTTSNDNQSNSYTLRQRQFWGKAETASRFAITGGQMWSLITETGLSTNNATEKLPNTIDPQYMVGFNWTRQPGVRLQQQFGDIKTGLFTAAIAVEQAQTLSAGVNGTAPAGYLFQGAGVGGGLYNATASYSNNVAPDVLVKGTLDYPHAHIEVGGLARFFRTTYNPLTSGNSSTYTYDTTKQLKDTKTGGGAFASVRVTPGKFVTLAVQGLAGQGVARYSSATLSDVTVKNDGTLEPIRHYSGLFSLETHPTKKLDVFTYYGGEYNQRTQYQIGSNIFGYGATSANNAGCYAVAAVGGNAATDTATNCAGLTRYIQEGMIGWTYRIVDSPKIGRLQYSMTYQYIQRNLWSGSVAGTTVPNAPTGPRALDNMIHVGMRYYIP